MNEYIEFEVDDPARFQILKKVFQKIKSDKNNDSFEDEEIYLKLFDEKAKSYFGWYSEKEIENWKKKWFATPYENRWNSTLR